MKLLEQNNKHLRNSLLINFRSRLDVSNAILHTKTNTTKGLRNKRLRNRANLGDHSKRQANKSRQFQEFKMPVLESGRSNRIAEFCFKICSCFLKCFYSAFAP